MLWSIVKHESIQDSKASTSKAGNASIDSRLSRDTVGLGPSSGKWSGFDAIRLQVRLVVGNKEY